MLCHKCKDKPVARGVKSIKCFSCGEDVVINVEHSICSDCSNKLGVCSKCGREVTKRRGRTICELVEESLLLIEDRQVYSNLVEIKEKSEKMKDKLLKYCNAIEELGLGKIDKDYDN